jgi:hypothetical protein
MGAAARGPLRHDFSHHRLPPIPFYVEDVFVSPTNEVKEK